MYIQLAPGKLKPGVDDKTISMASDKFQDHFVSQQKGIIKRILLKGIDGAYADLVFFESKAAAEQVAAAEQAGHPACEAFFQLFEMDTSKPDMGVLSFEDIKSYGKPV
ncbi:hypothetical protein [Leptospira stimsonii]|uniref:ABM domain-containing protein n=1 Tax=Leptospira stimsonii TaxID=2202203 RepID=A0A8B3CIA9_9LEPT|nr:hypothetical protein [Leptospira stimsonii]RHX83212.1 hypothetical protein DLM78_22145 [Leptospira stimsonii]